MVIFHIDANSAYLSWEAAYRLENGSNVDLRNIPSVVGGDPKKRSGIVLAKSIPAKKYKIKTGETLYEARQKCPHLLVVPPNYDLYLKCSQAMYDILCSYSSKVQRYSVDECFLDYTDSEEKFGDPVKTAFEIKEKIKNQLGFTVNVGVSVNKLLAKMASELKKPDALHTLFPEEIQEKLWPLPVEELFMVGRATSRKLRRININTIGDLACTNVDYLKALLKTHGVVVWNYANGIDTAVVKNNDEIIQKGIGNSTTIPFDVSNEKEAQMVLLALTERVSMRLRNMKCLCYLISVSIKTDGFSYSSHQMKLKSPTNSTTEIFKVVKKLFAELWQHDPLRHLGVRVSELISDDFYQFSFFDDDRKEKNRQLDTAVDAIRHKYGDASIVRSCFVHSRLSPVQGGVNEGDYLMMSGSL